MRWLSRWYRTTALPEVSITMTAVGDAQVAKPKERSWTLAFSVLNDLAIPATWAVSVEQMPELAKLAIDSQVPHELAFLKKTETFKTDIPSFRKLQSLAVKAQVLVRSILLPGTQVHPAILDQLGISVVVPTTPRTFSRTGQFRALAWNIWEAPPTDRLALPFAKGMSNRLGTGLEQLLRHSTRLHVVLELHHAVNRHDLKELDEWLRRVADYKNRGWLRTSTVGEHAAALKKSLEAPVPQSSRAA